MAAKPNKIVAGAEAARIWGLYGFTRPDEMVIENVAMAQGVLVMDGPLDSATARLVRGGNIAIARISDRIREAGRRRFAIAHELGHWLLHRDQAHLLACTDDDISYAKDTSAPLEVEASIFAGNLLLPEELFQKKAADRLPTSKVIKELAEYFDSTLTATALRFVETATDYFVFVLSEAGRIRWWRPSGSFEEKGLWLDTRTPVPRNSAAAAFFRGDVVPEGPTPVDLSAWLGDVPGIHAETVLEQAIPLASYGQVISLLWLPSRWR